MDKQITIFAKKMHLKHIFYLFLRMKYFFSFLKILNFIKLIFFYFISVVYKKEILLKHMPYFLSFESFAGCNLKCTECPMGNSQIKRESKQLSFPIFKKIIDETHSFLCCAMIYFQGEPFLNKNIFDMIYYAHKKKIYTIVSTNAQLIDEEVAMKIISSGLDKIIISIDGTDQQTYEKYRKGGSLQKAIDSIHYINKERKNNKHLFIEVQFIVFKHNEHQINEIKKLGINWGADKVSIKTAQIYDFNQKEELIPDDKKFSRYIKKGHTWQLKKKLHNRCFRIFGGAVIDADGNVLPCCYDKLATHIMGNASNESFKNIWLGKQFMNFRKQVFCNRKQFDICQNCNE